jgi:hypothetical protein
MQLKTIHLTILTVADTQPSFCHSLLCQNSTFYGGTVSRLRQLVRAGAVYIENVHREK